VNRPSHLGAHARPRRLVITPPPDRDRTQRTRLPRIPGGAVGEAGRPGAAHLPSGRLPGLALTEEASPRCVGRAEYAQPGHSRYRSRFSCNMIRHAARPNRRAVRTPRTDPTSCGGWQPMNGPGGSSPRSQTPRRRAYTAYKPRRRPATASPLSHGPRVPVGTGSSPSASSPLPGAAPRPANRPRKTMLSGPAATIGRFRDIYLRVPGAGSQYGSSATAQVSPSASFHSCATVGGASAECNQAEVSGTFLDHVDQDLASAPGPGPASLLC
jgi:hypothetical protein